MMHTTSMARPLIELARHAVRLPPLVARLPQLYCQTQWLDALGTGLQQTGRPSQCRLYAKECVCQSSCMHQSHPHYHPTLPQAHLSTLRHTPRCCHMTGHGHSFVMLHLLLPIQKLMFGLWFINCVFFLVSQRRWYAIRAYQKSNPPNVYSTFYTARA